MTEHNKRFWTSNEKTKVYDMRSQGKAFSEIAEALGRTVQSVKHIYYHDKRYGTVAKSGRYSRWTEEEKEMAYELWKKGHSCREIGDFLGRSSDGVRHILRHRGNKETAEQCCYHYDEGITERRKSMKKGPENAFRRKVTICWTCRNAMVNCKKPVEGFTAEREAYFVQRGTLAGGNKEFLGYSYLVSECPNYEEEPWLRKENK